jgi:type VI secretion system protein ImpG
MDRRFLHYYEAELQHLRDLGGEFARAHPQVAGKLGLDTVPCPDPYVERLLEGFAFLAARVQLKLDAEYQTFAEHLLDLVYPDYLAPTPAIALVQFTPDLRAGSLEDGYSIERGSRLNSRLLPQLQTRCTFTTAHEVRLWPLRIADASYLAGAALAASGLPRRREVEAAIRIRLETQGEMPFQALSLDRLTLHLRVTGPRAFRLYEAIFGHGQGLVLQPGGTPPAWRHELGREAIGPVGFEEEDALLPCPPEAFDGYRLVKEYFAFPARFLFFELSGLRPAVRRHDGRALEFFILLDKREPSLEESMSADDLALFVTPAVNLFEKACEPILLNRRQRDSHVIPDRVRPLDYEVHSLLEVTAEGGNGGARGVARLYRLDARDDDADLFYTVERRPRLFSARDLARGAARSSYLGGEVFLCLTGGRTGAGEPKRLFVKAACSNRDLPLFLLRTPGESQFTAETGAPIAAIALLGEPSSPQPSLAQGEPARARAGQSHGEIAWRLVNHLTLNYLSLVDGGEGQAADTLREMLKLYADFAEPAVARQVDGLARVASEPVIDRLPIPGPMVFGRGLEIQVNLDERRFEGGGAFLLGAVLEQFFRRYVSINAFTRTVVKSVERGEIMRWPARTGRRHLL